MTLSGFFKKTATAAMALLCFSGSLEAANDKLKIHYARPDKVYDNLGIWFWDHVKNPSKNWPTGATKPSGKDKFGIPTEEMRMMPHIYIILRDQFFEKKREREEVLASVITRNDQGRLVPKNDIFSAL